MEVKINKEIRDYSESVFFGLSLRQLVFSALAVSVATGLYFLLKGRLGTETLSWVCVLAAAPFAALGFIRYHGMNADELLWTFLRSEVIEPNELPFHAENSYWEALKGIMSPGLKRRKNAEVYKESAGAGKREI